MKFIRTIAILAIAGLVWACSPPKAAGTGGADAGVIRFATDWRAQAEQGGFYQALATGEYEKRGLKVQIIQGGPGVNVPQLLAAGAVEAGMGSNSFIALNLANQGAPVKAVAAMMQKDPQVLIAHPDQGIERIEDLKGRPILLSDASVTAFWVWLKSKYGFEDAQIRKYTFNAAPFLSDKSVAQQGYLTSEPYTIEKTAGLKPKVFLLADNGYPSYAAMILFPQSLIDKDPARVRAFVEASAAGWKSYLTGDPKPGDALILKDNPEMTQDVLDQAREKMRQYALVEGGDAAGGGVGVMTDARWKAFAEMAITQGVYPKGLDYTKAYTLDFVRPAAGK
ncbi:MAG: ABC transporter substrate-binding protein [Phenylobacterium sp.]|uniref:ABC transporter substrate-binding protein n=1 Tax=Phenylobacterium sp. TaxID=1871053 RepID=UPI0025D3796E|nr:ABC transporter substrate-binding protein [Phenylobacterium sp.]MCA6224254.1 ABC transporter substrate-binding protein [Phenylobacterium sp.]MCA6226493.1 ABC transporter substrate-binding protein [Phenylobacterium sp.]MCA6231742.1 ABC transporter substrate-binding protein [Phenylobacterium sp.]MCA6236148.1 ABC transporter substrate-binding protein [Phenylobacterium sp.]MCA6247868.1 ABC transporter substrate-binding protein [Phenylobacterium sp.]